MGSVDVQHDERVGGAGRYGNKIVTDRLRFIAGRQLEYITVIGNQGRCRVWRYRALLSQIELIDRTVSFSLIVDGRPDYLATAASGEDQFGIDGKTKEVARDPAGAG